MTLRQSARLGAPILAMFVLLAAAPVQSAHFTEFDLKMVLDLVTTAFIVVGGIIALLQLRQGQRRRSREAALQMLHSFQTPEFLAAVNIVFELPEGLSKREIEERLGHKIACLLMMFGTFESIGILVFRRDLDLQMVEDFFSGVLVIAGSKLKRYMDEMREISGRQTYYEWYQWLSELVQRREKTTAPTPAYVEFRDWV